MRRYKTTVLLAIITMLAMVFLASSVGATPPDWMMRQGSIGWALTQSDNTLVSVDCVVIDKIKAKQQPGYFVIRECFNYKDRVVVLTQPNQALRLGMNVDVSGTLITLPNGCRAIVSPTVLGYTDEDGVLLTRGGPFIKGLLEPTPWEWKVDLTVNEDTGTMSSMSTPQTISPNDDEPNATPAEGASYYATVAEILEAQSSTQTTTNSVRTQSYYDGIPEVRGLPDGSLVELEAKGITAVGTENIGGTNYNYFDMIENPPATDTIRCYYTGTAAVTDRVNRIAGQIRHTSPQTPVIDIDTGPDYDPQILEGSCQLAAQGSIAWAKTFPDGAQLPTQLQAKVVTADQADLPGALYVQETVASGYFGGIRVIYSGASRSRGDIVNITGTVDTANDGEREITDASVTFVESDTTPGPFGLNNRALGGTYFNVFTPGVTWPEDSAYGLNNKGLLVKTWGRVTGVDADSKCLYVDDGSRFNDGSGLMGVRVVWNWLGQGSITPPAQGSYVSVTGLSGSSNLGSDHIVRTIRLRDSDDITTHAASNLSCQLDHSLPTTNLNNTAGAARCNIRWASVSANIGCGDDFALPSGQWVIDMIRVWIVPDVPVSPLYNLGDHFQSIALYTGAATGSLVEAASGTFVQGTSSTDNPRISFVRTSYQHQTEKDYQSADGTYSDLWQVEFSNLGWEVTGGTSYVFGVHAVPRVDRQLFLHATHWSSQGDGLIRQFDINNLQAGSSTISGSGWFGGVSSDVNVQIYAHPQ